MQNTVMPEEKRNMFSHTVNMDAPTDSIFSPDSCPHGNPRANLYNLCIGCPDWPCHCNGPKLSEFLDIMLVRDFERKVRDHFNIKNERIAEKTYPIVSKATVVEFFSNKTKDFMWTTVAYIDHAMKLIVLEMQLGKDFDPNMVLDNPCPASSSKLQQMMAEKDAIIAKMDLELNNLRKLAQKAEEEDRTKIDHLKDQLRLAEGTAERRYNLIVARDYIIIALVVLCIILLVLTTMYISWDFTHDGIGIFW